MEDVRGEKIRQISLAILGDGRPKPRAVAEATAQALLICAVPVLMRLCDIPYDARLVDEVMQAGWLAMCQALEAGRE